MPSLFDRIPKDENVSVGNNPLEYIFEESKRQQQQEEQKRNAQINDTDFLSNVVHVANGVTPFRQTISEKDKERAIAIKLSKLPNQLGNTTPAKLGYTKTNPKKSKRIAIGPSNATHSNVHLKNYYPKDIKIPQELSAMDNKQNAILQEISLNEDKLKYLNRSQKVLDVRNIDKTVTSTQYEKYNFEDKFKLKLKYMEKRRKEKEELKLKSVEKESVEKGENEGEENEGKENEEEEGEKEEEENIALTGEEEKEGMKDGKEILLEEEKEDRITPQKEEEIETEIENSEISPEKENKVISEAENQVLPENELSTTQENFESITINSEPVILDKKTNNSLPLEEHATVDEPTKQDDLPDEKSGQDVAASPPSSVEDNIDNSYKFKLEDVTTLSDFPIVTDFNAAPRVKVTNIKAPTQNDTSNSIFSIFRLNRPQPLNTANMTGSSKITATPNNPEYIVKTDKGYISKVVYDKIRLDIGSNNREINKYLDDQSIKYDKKKYSYSKKLTKLDGKLAKLSKKMDKLKQENDEELKISDFAHQKHLLDLNSAHFDTRQKIYDENDLLKEKKIADAEKVKSDQIELNREIDEIKKLESALESKHTEYVETVKDLSNQLDEHVDKLNASIDEQKELSKHISELKASKSDLVAQINLAEQTHKEATNKIASIDNKEYLPQLTAIDTEINSKMDELTRLKKAIADEVAAYRLLEKDLENKRIEEEARLAKEREEIEKLHQAELIKQKEEYAQKEKEMESAYQKHYEELNEKHNSEVNNLNGIVQNKDAALLKEQEEREKVAREKVRLAGLVAIRDQEDAKQKDLLLKTEHLEKARKQAEAQAGAEEAVLNNKNDSVDVPRIAPDNINENGSIYTYYTQEEIKSLE
ncbi:uncharacterized protein SCDLUD_002377 [Saccharomycodes ludwigii]|uniref:uncharacterized protein n=1 Tax=Saccharomycodes ludwigii TaxID=36035 RepID=UPI001E88BF7A|nr:hypothetical protein SCDLUD_002377 [Saccharomycodes ludwigii]KAH3900917.1 hypothetical protein SCDLUD_002377 [Saccharomycodes ludwigii]